MSQESPAPRSPRPSRRATVLACTAAAALLAGSTRTVWIEALAPDLAGTAQQVTVTGSDAAPAVLALSLVAIAASLATGLSSRWLRFLTGPVLLATGAGSAIAALGVVQAPEQAARSAVASATGVLGGDVLTETTAWPLITLAPAMAVAVLGIVALVVGGRWPVGTRYRSAAVAATADPGQDPAAAWDALTRGEDPSLLETETDGEPEPEPGAEPEPYAGADASEDGDPRTPR